MNPPGRELVRFVLMVKQSQNCLCECPPGFDVIQVTATDADDESTYNGIIRFSIEDQEPKEPRDSMFAIDPVTGAIRVNADGLDWKVMPLKLSSSKADQCG